MRYELRLENTFVLSSCTVRQDLLVIRFSTGQTPIRGGCAVPFLYVRGEVENGRLLSHRPRLRLWALTRGQGDSGRVLLVGFARALCLCRAALACAAPGSAPDAFVSHTRGASLQVETSALRYSDPARKSAGTWLLPTNISLVWLTERRTGWLAGGLPAGELVSRKRRCRFQVVGIIALRASAKTDGSSTWCRRPRILGWA